MANSEGIEVVAEFERCPVCGSTERFAESVAAEEIEKGLFGKDLKFGLHYTGGKVVDPRRLNRMLTGSKVPQVTALYDVCMGYPDKPCGNIYAVRLQRGEVRTGPRRQN